MLTTSVHACFEEADHSTVKASTPLFIALLAAVSASPAEEPDAAVRAALAASDTFFLRALVPEGAPVEISINNLPETTTFPASLEKHDGTFIRNLNVGPKSPIDTTGLPRGLYRLELVNGGVWSRPIFGIGTFEQLHKELAVRCAAFSGEDRIAINLQAWLRRLEILDQTNKADPLRSPNERDEYKAVQAASALEDVMDHLEKGEEPFRDRPGVHLRGFRSVIDDQVIHYRIFVPTSYRREGEGLPLVIIPPPVFAASRPFLESAFVARLHDAEKSIRIAKELGMGILWPAYRVRPYGNPVDFAHYEEVLAAVRADYHFDPRRIYLLGYCSGGMFSAMEAVRHPQRYAALAFVNPVLHRRKGRFDEHEEFRSHRSYRTWLRETDPLRPLAELTDMPIHIRFDGVDADHGPLSDSVEYVESARAFGGNPQFDYYRTVMSSQAELMEQQIKWLAQQRRSSSSDAESSARRDASSIARALSQRFVVIGGTIGEAAEKAVASRWLADFQKAWQDTAYTACRVIEDTSLNRAEEQASNLVLIGNASTNMIWQRLADRIPLIMTRDEVRIGSQRWTGETLAVQVWFPHPDHSGRKIVLLGAYDLDRAAVGTMELALDGWYDFAIWRNDGERASLVYAGRFAQDMSGAPIAP